MKTLLLLGITLALASAVLAYPTLVGPTGLVLVPTAAITPAGQFQIAADLLNEDSNDATFPVRALYGFNDSWEFGATFSTSEAAGSEDTWGIFGKYLLPATLGDAAWALGAGYYDNDNSSTIAAFLSATKELDENLSGTASLIWNSTDEDDEETKGQLFGSDDDSDFMVAVGAQATFGDLVVVGEYINMLPGSSLNAAARYPLTDALTVQMGFMHDLDIVTLGANYTFGGAAE